MEVRRHRCSAEDHQRSLAAIPASLNIATGAQDPLPTYSNKGLAPPAVQEIAIHGDDATPEGLSAVSTDNAK